MRFKVLRMPLLLGFAGILAATAAQADPSALVEDISSDRDDVQLLDYLEPGQTIKLAAGETIVIGYLRSCVQETITGGTVTVGENESAVSGGQKKTGYVDCDSGPVVAQVGAEQEAGAAAFRDGGADELNASRILFGVSPLVKLNQPAEAVEISRLDAEEVIHRVSANGAIVDFAKAKIVLTRGATYRAKAGSREVIFKISRLAEGLDASPLTRLLPL